MVSETLELDKRKADPLNDHVICPVSCPHDRIKATLKLFRPVGRCPARRGRKAAFRPGLTLVFRILTLSRRSGSDLRTPEPSQPPSGKEWKPGSCWCSNQ